MQEVRRCKMGDIKQKIVMGANKTKDRIEYLKTVNMERLFIQLGGENIKRDKKVFNMLFNGHTLGECESATKVNRQSIIQLVHRYYCAETWIQDLGGSPIWYMLPIRVVNICARAGIKSIDELYEMPYEELKKVRNLGTVHINKLIKAFNDNGLHPMFEKEAKQSLKKSYNALMPCCVKMPENQTAVLVYLDWGAYDIAWLDGDLWKSELTVYDFETVIAWMPLPEPYKAGDPE
jgi:hypothetical protein